jgi:hypothetical protein
LRNVGRDGAGPDRLGRVGRHDEVLLPFVSVQRR